MPKKKEQSAKSPAFQWYPKDWLSSRDVRSFDAEQRGWYIQLLNEAWECEPQGVLPDDEKALRELAGVTEKPANIVLSLMRRLTAELQEAVPDSPYLPLLGVAEEHLTNYYQNQVEVRFAEVLKKFKPGYRGLSHSRLTRELEKQVERKARLKEWGKRGGNKRWSKRSESKPGYPPPPAKGIAKPRLASSVAQLKTTPRPECVLLLAQAGFAEHTAEQIVTQMSAAGFEVSETRIEGVLHEANRRAMAGRVRDLRGWVKSCLLENWDLNKTPTRDDEQKKAHDAERIKRLAETEKFEQQRAALQAAWDKLDEATQLAVYEQAVAASPPETRERVAKLYPGYPGMHTPILRAEIAKIMRTLSEPAGQLFG